MGTGGGEGLKRFSDKNFLIFSLIVRSNAF